MSRKLLLLSGVALIGGPAWAQITTPAQQVPTPSNPTSQADDAQTAPAPPVSPEDAEFKRIDNLTQKGWITPVPTFDDTLLRNYGGWRSALADAGFGFTIWALNVGSYDFNRAGSAYPGQQLYNGQKANLQTSYQSAVLTYDLGRVGLAGAQLIAVGISDTNGYQARDGIRGFRLKEAYVYLPIAKGKAELEAGLISNSHDYLGTNIGGSLASGTLGPQASIPVEAGQSYALYSAPTVSLKINWTKQLYTRSAIQRSISPAGSTAEFNANPTGFAFTVPNAKPLFIQEIGYKVLAAKGRKSWWIRGGALYNTSHYALFDGTGTHHNYAFYIAGDRQLTQPDWGRPERGLYVGATFNAAPASVDAISRYYEGRVYLKGPFASRPHDLVSLVVTFNEYGMPGRVAHSTADFFAYPKTVSETASYSYRLIPGLYLQPGFAIVRHPVESLPIGTAINGLLGLTALF